MGSLVQYIKPFRGKSDLFRIGSLPVCLDSRQDGGESALFGVVQSPDGSLRC